MRVDVDLPFDAIEGAQDPVFSLATDAHVVGESEPHAHNKAQLLYVETGVLTVFASGGIWTIPPSCALWVPAGVEHWGRASGRIRTVSLYFDPSLSSRLSDRCCIHFVHPLLREVILRISEGPSAGLADTGRVERLVAVLMDELESARAEAIHLPMPNDRRLRRLADMMIERPDLRFTIDEWGARVGASNRTLTRLFQRETGMSFTRWRHQLHVGLALQRLATGDPVTTIAGDLGYESVSAFITMFRRMLGTTPARYFDAAAG